MIDEKKLIDKIANDFPLETLNKNDEMLICDIIDIIENQPKVGEWISVKDRLPENEGMYLITSKVLDRTEVQYAFYQKNIGMFICNGKAIAWMPLPEPYKGDD